MKNLSTYFAIFFILLIGFTSCEENEPFENCPDVTINIDNVPGSTVYRFAAQLDGIQDVRLSWSVDGEEVSTGNLDEIASQILDYNFEPGKYTVCVKVASDTCPVEVCKEIEVIRDETDPCPDLFFKAREYERPSQYKFIADFEGIETTRYSWFINDDLISSSDQIDTNYLIHEFKEPGRYEVCIKAETDSCPNGTSYCKVIEIDEVSDDCADIEFSRDGDYLYERSGKERTYTWSVNDDIIDDQEVVLEAGRKFSLRKLTPGTYKICITVITDDCPEGVKFCKEITIDENETECPNLSFIAEQDGDNPAYHFMVNFEGANDISWLGWYIDGELVEDSNNGDNNTFYYQFAPGRYEVCLKTETPNCPNGTQYCKVIEVEGADCPDLKFSRDGNILFADFPGRDTLEWYGWYVDGEQREDEGTMHDGDNRFSLEGLEPGTYKICLFTETPECPNGTEFCETIVIQ